MPQSKSPFSKLILNIQTDVAASFQSPDIIECNNFPTPSQKRGMADWNIWVFRRFAFFQDFLKITKLDDFSRTGNPTITSPGILEAMGALLKFSTVSPSPSLVTTTDTLSERRTYVSRWRAVRLTPCPAPDHSPHSLQTLRTESSTPDLQQRMIKQLHWFNPHSLSARVITHDLECKTMIRCNSLFLK